MYKKGHALVKYRIFQELPNWRNHGQARAYFRYLGLNHSMANCSLTIRYPHRQGEHNSLLYLGAGKFTPSQNHLNESASTSAASKRDEITQVINMMTATIGIVLLVTAKIRLI